MIAPCTYSKKNKSGFQQVSSLFLKKLFQLYYHIKSEGRVVYVICIYHWPSVSKYFKIYSLSNSSHQKD